MACPPSWDPPGCCCHCLNFLLPRRAPAQAFLPTTGPAYTLPCPARGKANCPGNVRGGRAGHCSLQGIPGGCGEKSPQEKGEALTDTRFPRSVPALSGQRDGKGVPEAAATPGDVLRARSLVLSGRRGVRRATAQGCFSRARPSPRPSAGPGRGGGPAGRAGPDAAPGTAGRADPESPAWPSSPATGSPGSPTHRPGRGRIPASPQSPGLGRTRPAGGRQLHAAAFSARPAPAPPAHFPQEMINSGSGAFPWQLALAQAGVGGARALPRTLPRARPHSHAGPPTRRTPGSAQMFRLGPAGPTLRTR